MTIRKSINLFIEDKVLNYKKFDLSIQFTALTLMHLSLTPTTISGSIKRLMGSIKK